MELPFTLAFDPPSQAAPRAVLRLRRTWLAGLLVLLAIGRSGPFSRKASRPAGWMSIPDQDSIRNAMSVRRPCRFPLRLVFAMVPVVPATTPAPLAFAAGGADPTTLVVLAAAVMVGNTADSIPAVDGQIVHVGDDVRTGPDRLALPTFFDGSETQLQGNSHITVEVPSPTAAEPIAAASPDATARSPDGSHDPESDAPAHDQPGQLAAPTRFIASVISSVPSMTTSCRRGSQADCVTSVVLCADTDGQVGNVEVASHIVGHPALHLTTHGDAAHISRAGASRQPMPAAHLELLHQATQHLHDVQLATRAQVIARHVVRAGLHPRPATPKPDR